MEELPHWFDTGYFTVTQLIPVRKLSSRSADAFNSDTISYHRNVSTKTVWGVVHDILKYMELERVAVAYIKPPPKQEQQEIIIRRCMTCKDLWSLTIHLLIIRVWFMKENGQCFVLMLPEKPVLAGYHWACYLFSELEKSRMPSKNIHTNFSIHTY